MIWFLFLKNKVITYFYMLLIGALTFVSIFLSLHSYISSSISTIDIHDIKIRGII